MVKVKLKDIVSEEFTGAFAQLMQQELEPAASFELTRLHKRLKEIWADYDTAKMELVEKFGKRGKDKKLKPKKNDKGVLSYELKDPQKFSEALGNLNHAEVDISQIKFDKLGITKISPAVLSPLVDVVLV